jgi:hypothetical protein
MENYKEESTDQNPHEDTGHTNYAPNSPAPISDSTSQRKVKTKIEIKLGYERFNTTRWLYNQYGLKTPTWLRRTFILNQFRRKSLNDNLLEAQLDNAFCGSYTATDEWYDQLHSVWHDINRRPLCA